MHGISTLMRNRLSITPESKPLTHTEDVDVYETEAFILEAALEKFQFSHWIAHHFALHLRLDGKLPDAYSCGSDFNHVQEAVARGLYDSKFYTESRDISKCSNEQTLNHTIIRQYTSDGGPYSAANRVLRLGHNGEDVGQNPLVPWILQLNCAIRILPEFLGTTYRGAQMSNAELACYTEGKIFIWSSFTSTSKSLKYCADGNVIFEMKPGSAFILHDKRAGREIDAISEFPTEEEVLLPMCCGFRVLQITTTGRKTRIRVEILDHY